VKAPLPEAQLVETALLASITFSTTIATKAARIVDAASSDGRERPVIEFGARRAHGFQAAILAARAAVIGGCVATSNVEAGRRYGLSVSGTMAHSWVLSWVDEAEAFARFASVFPSRTTALVDTYDTVGGVRSALRAVPGLEAVRLDSGDLARLSKEARAILDAEGRQEVRIFASGDLEEDKIRALVLGGAPIDAFGVGTDLVTSRDAPALGAVYKLVEIETTEGPRPVMKTSAGKMTRPGAKQVFRREGPGGRFQGDVIGLADEPAPGGATPLLVPLVAKGRVVSPPEPIDSIRNRARLQRGKLPPALRGPEGAADHYPVIISERLETLTEKTRRAQT
jgi:nicotinate phosphoribosyltransferase